MLLREFWILLKGCHFCGKIERDTVKVETLREILKYLKSQSLFEI